MHLKKLKQERTAQWGNNRKVPRGWNRYRASTFLEVVGAKTDRALQCQDLIFQASQELDTVLRKLVSCSSRKQKKILAAKIEDLNQRLKKLEFDALDSCYDAYNYMGKLIELIEKDPKFLTSLRMP